MTQIEAFEIASGTIPGRRHVGRGSLLYGRNNQDACGFRSTSGLLVAVVCDGCSSGSRSELGAQLGVELFLEALQRRARSLSGLAMGENNATTLLKAILDEAGSEILWFLDLVAARCGGSREQVVREAMLFTIVGAVVTPSITAIFSYGDGVYAVNGTFENVGPFPNNAPPYIGYRLIDEELCDSCGSHRGFQLDRLLPTEALDSLLIGTDGVEDLARVAREGRSLPGRSERCVPIHELWTDDRYFANPDALRRYFALANSQVPKVEDDSGRISWRPGLLPDDTTVVVVRRRRSGAVAS